ncbi:MAG: CDP-alcohol phosphatidyltransferase [Lentisphaerae bacterium ADurb.Bin242]|nr:MAG: CDP-alcohol phosphatidyltransferase [Lentisphaerae bacterium ADurb.Bin242]
MKQHFRDLLARNRWLKWVPNALTLGNSLCGFAAILYTLQVYEKMMYRDGAAGIENIFAISAGMILCAMVFDAFDGYAARLLNAASIHGIQMDSLADMVTFGVAPAAVVAVMAHALNSLRPTQFVVVWCLCAVYLGCAALRLAKYNVHAMLEKKSSEKFSGLPSPGAAAAICSVIIFYAVEGSEKHSMHRMVAFLPYYAAVLGLLMVSEIPYQHFGKWIFSIPRHKKRLLIVSVVLIAACYETAWTALILINGYVIWAPLATIAAKLGLLKSPSDANI